MLTNACLLIQSTTFSKFNRIVWGNQMVVRGCSKTGVIVGLFSGGTGNFQYFGLKSKGGIVQNPTHIQDE